ncbi:MAG: CidA/LrgA family protein [Bacilli bacterium]|nr:CidA/LrgA family protein [Bacilli bacterium]
MLKNIFKVMIQIAIIYFIYFTGNFISGLISDFIVIPGNIIGMVILLLLLNTNLLKLSMIEETGNFMIKYMGFFFVPLTVGLMDSYYLIKDSIIQILVILVVSCICVMFVSSKVTDILISYNERKKTND